MDPEPLEQPLAEELRQLTNPKQWLMALHLTCTYLAAKNIDKVELTSQQAAAMHSRHLVPDAGYGHCSSPAYKVSHSCRCIESCLLEVVLVRAHRHQHHLPGLSLHGRAICCATGQAYEIMRKTCMTVLHERSMLCSGMTWHVYAGAVP